MADLPPFPDVLGAITGGTRAAVGVVQAALGARPAAVAPGRPFELLMLVQNASDSRLDVALELALPKQFRGKSGRLAVSVAAGEVGYVSLSVAALPDAAHGSYKLGVDLDAKPAGKPNRARDASGGVLFDPSVLRPAQAKRIADLRGVAFSAAKRLGRNTVEVAVQVGGAAPAGEMPQAGWVSLWTMADLNDDGLLVRYFGDLMRLRALPQLKRQLTLAPLVAVTDERFRAAGYPLEPAEALMVAKLMALILEYAAARENGLNPFQAGMHNLLPVLSGSDPSLPLPRWARGMLRLLARDERAAGAAAPAVTKMLYDDLLWDAIMLAFSLVETATGEDVGTEAEMHEYAARLLQNLRAAGQLDFVHVYMPLVLGGIVINDQITTQDTNLVEALRELWVILDQRRQEPDENGEPVVQITEQLIERALQAYGYRRGST